MVIGCGEAVGSFARPPVPTTGKIWSSIRSTTCALLEHKIGALDQAVPLAGWELPDGFPTLRRLLEARMGKAGKREYVQVLRLVETFDLEVLHGAVKDALRLGAIGDDAVKHLVLCRIERRPPKLDLDIYPYLPRANVATTAAASYMSLLGGGAIMTDTPQVLLAHHLKTLKLPTFLREYDKLARHCATEGADHVRYRVRLTELELIDRERRMVERRISRPGFPPSTSRSASFDCRPSHRSYKILLPKVLAVARANTSSRRENIRRARQLRHDEPISPSVSVWRPAKQGKGDPVRRNLT